VRRSFFLGWIAGVVFFLITLSWISSVAWEGVALLPPFLALYFGGWSLFIVMVVRPLFLEPVENSTAAVQDGVTAELASSSIPLYTPPLRSSFLVLHPQQRILNWLLSEKQPVWFRSLGAVFLSAAAWVGMEWLRGTLFTGFGWNAFGVSFYQDLPLIQFADITGVAGLSFLGVMTSCMAALAFQRMLQQKKVKVVTKNLCHIHADVALVLILVLAAFVYGMLEVTRSLPPQERLSVAAVQGNIPQNHKWDRAFEEEIMNVYETETQLALQAHPDLVVWPEAATPRPLLNEEKIFSQVNELVQEGHVDLLAGSLHYEENPQRDYNAAILLSPAGARAQVYAKIHLVPFGEFIPCRKTFPLFQWIVGDRVLGDFDAGPGPKILHLSTKPVAIAPLICFEDTLGDLVRRFALCRAQLLITLTNDGWFGHTMASRQHAINALFRAVETKLPLLRVANTGVTCVIDRYGRMTQILRDPHGSMFFEGVLLSQLSVPRDPVLTFYTRYGDWFSFVCLGLMALAILWRGVQIKRM